LKRSEPPKKEKKKKKRKRDEEDAIDKKEEHKEECVEAKLEDTVSQEAICSTDNITVYIEGLPYASNEEEVRRLFATAGTVSDVRLPRYQDSGRLRGYGHIDFATSEEAANAIVKMNGATLGGRYLNVAPAVEKGAKVTAIKKSLSTKSRPPGCRTIFVKNLPYDINEDALRTVFLRFGKIVDVRIPIWNDTKRRKGVGYIQFATDYATEEAFKSEITIRGRNLILDFDSSQQPKASFKTTQGVPWSKTKVGKRLTKHAKHASAAAD